MRALTLYRPWPWAIFHLGPRRAKRVENRIWPPPKSILGERIAIHAGARFDDGALDFITEAGGKTPPEPSEHALGIIGVARIVGYCEPSVPNLVLRHEAPARRATSSERRWYMGSFGWFLDDVVALSSPIECRGARQLWTVPRHLEERIIEELKRRKK